MGSININGKTYTGNNIVVTNGKVIIDGKEAESGNDSTNIKVIVNGDLNKLDCTDAEINGNVIGGVDATNLTCEIIGGDVDANTVNCTTIGGDVDANTVNCNHVEGSIDANVVNK